MSLSLATLRLNLLLAQTIDSRIPPIHGGMNGVDGSVSATLPRIWAEVGGDSGFGGAFGANQLDRQFYARGRCR